MINDSSESFPEIHVDEDTDFRVTTLLSELHETSAMDGSGCDLENTGPQHRTGCCWSPYERSPRDSPSKIPCSLDGNNVFPLSSCTPDYSCEKKQTRRSEELHKKNPDLALASDSCIGRGTYAYLPGNGCYKKHKMLVRRQLRKTSSKGKFAQECDDEDCDPQTLVEFQVYMAKLEPATNLESGDGYNRTLQVKENIGRLDDEKASVAVQKSSSADITVLRKATKSSLPNVRARSSSGHHGRTRQDRELDERAEDTASTAGSANLAWVASGSRLAESSHADDSTFERESCGIMLDSEIMKRIKEIKKSVTWSELSSDDRNKNTSDVFAHNVALTADTVRNKKTKRQGERIGTTSAVPLARLPLKRNPYLYKPKVYHLSSLITGPCLGPHQPALPKDSLQAFDTVDTPVSSINSVIGSRSQNSLPLGNDFFPILEGRKIRAKKQNFRFL